MEGPIFGILRYLQVLVNGWMEVAAGVANIIRITRITFKFVNNALSVY